MTKLAAKLLKSDTHVASQITAWRPASPRQTSVTSCGRCLIRRPAARKGIIAESVATSRSVRDAA